jgi:hypothetical protein
MSDLYDPADNSAKSYALAIETMRVKHEAGKELVLAAKEAAVMLAEICKAANQSPNGPGFNRLMKAIKAYEATHGL